MVPTAPGELFDGSTPPIPDPPSELLPGSSPASPAAPATLLDGGVPSISATGTVTVLGSLTSGQTVTINGAIYTALVPDNGAEARLFDDAAGLVEVINGLRSGVSEDPNVSASLDGSVVTLTARIGGTVGNALTLAKSGPTLVISGSHFTGGIDLPLPPGSII